MPNIKRDQLVMRSTYTCSSVSCMYIYIYKHWQSFGVSRGPRDLTGCGQVPSLVRVDLNVIGTCIARNEYSGRVSLSNDNFLFLARLGFESGIESAATTETTCLTTPSMRLH